MSRIWKDRSVKALLLGAALLTPIAIYAADDHNDGRRNNQGRDEYNRGRNEQPRYDGRSYTQGRNDQARRDYNRYDGRAGDDRYRGGYDGYSRGYERERYVPRSYGFSGGYNRYDRGRYAYGRAYA